VGNDGVLEENEEGRLGVGKGGGGVTVDYLNEGRGGLDQLNEPDVPLSNEPYTPSKEPYIPSKEPYIPSKEPYIPSTEEVVRTDDLKDGVEKVNCDAGSESERDTGGGTYMREGTCQVNAAGRGLLRAAGHTHIHIYDTHTHTHKRTHTHTHTHLQSKTRSHTHTHTHTRTHTCNTHGSKIEKES